MDYSNSALKHGDIFRVKITNESKYKLSGIPVDKNGDLYDHVPDIRLWAGPNTALKKSNFGEYAEISLMNKGLNRGILRGFIRKSGGIEKFQDNSNRYQASIRKLSFIQGDYEPPLSELSDEELSVDPTTTTETQDSEVGRSKYGEDDKWDERKSDTMGDLPDL